MRICVYGAASPLVDEDYIIKTEQLGKEIVNHGHSLVFGGGKNGLMGAAAKAVHENGGKVLGVIPKFFIEESAEILYKECDDVVLTDTMRERKQIMEENADAFIVVPGGIGTYEEFFEILTAKQLRRHNKPIAIYNINGYYNELNNAILSSINKNFIKERCLELYIITDNLDEIFKYVEAPVSEIGTLKELKDG